MIEMPTNDEIIEKTWGGAEAKYTRRETLRILMEQALSFSTSSAASGLSEIEISCVIVAPRAAF